ncbi:MAG TPA: hypothetical protein VFR49_15095 [Solirubrobacteraceae bacterium]|nr:hypothetical protein [Solirubrobacteraceae bacterium]
MGEHSPYGARLSLHRVEIPASVAPAQSHAGHQMMEDEIVQNDDAGPAAECLHDPAVRDRVVADVVERYVSSPAMPASPSPDNGDVDPLGQRR